MTAKLNEKDFTFNSDADGYTIYYKHHPIGGAGVKLPREKPLHWRYRNANLRDNRKQAQITINEILNSDLVNQNIIDLSLMRRAIDKINKETQ